MGAFFLLIFVLFAVGSLVRVLMAVFAPQAYSALLAEDERKRERRRGFFDAALTVATKFLKR